MIFHKGNKRLYDEWLNREAKVIQVTKWVNGNPEEIMFATELLDRDRIPWMIGSTGSRYALFRKEVKP